MPITCAAGFGQQRQQRRIAGGEVDHRHAGRDAVDDLLARTAARSGDSRPAPRQPTQESKSCTHCAPAAIWALRYRVIDRASRSISVAPGALVAVHQRLGVQVVAAAAPFDRVAGQRERRAGKADQRDVARQIGPRLADRLEDEVERAELFQLEDAIDVGRRADGVVDHRPFALGEIQLQAHRLQDRQQVGEDDRRIDAQPLDGGTHDLAAELRVLAQLEKARLCRGPRDTPPCSGPACRISQTGVTSVGSRRQAFRNGLSYQAACGSSGLAAGAAHDATTRRLRSRISPACSAAAATSGPILGCSGSISTGSSWSRSISLVVGPIEATTICRSAVAQRLLQAKLLGHSQQIRDLMGAGEQHHVALAGRRWPGCSLPAARCPRGKSH